MTDRVFMIPLWLRLWHWSNATLFLLLLMTGISLHFATPETPLIPFATARSIHNIAGILISILYVALITANFRSGNWRQFVPAPKGFMKRLMRQQMFYGRDIFKGESHPYPATPEKKFNPLQQITYLAVIYMAVPLLILSGFLFMFPEYLPNRLFGMGGVWPVAITHYLIAVLLTVFLVGHIYMATIGETILSDLKMMITGWHEGHAAPDSKEKTND